MMPPPGPPPTADGPGLPALAREYRWELAAAAALALLACGAPFAAEALVRRRRRLALHAAGGAENIPRAVRAAIERWFAASQPDAAGCVCAAAARAAVQACRPSLRKGAE